jgi:integrase
MSDLTLKRTATPGIYRRGSRYVVRFRDGGGRQHKRFARTLAEARDLKAALTADVRRGEYRQLSRVTFAEYAPQWIASYKGRTSRGVREATRDDYRDRLERDAIPFFGRMRLAEIEPRDLKAFVAKMAERGISQNTIRLGVAPVRALLADAVEEGLVRSNPAAGLRLFSRQERTEEHEPDGDIRAMSEDELTRVLDLLPAEQRLFFAFLAQTGLRIGEAVELRWGDLDLGARVLRVERRFYRGEVGRPKTKFGRRRLRLSEGLVRGLWERRRETGAGDDELVFTAGRGGRIGQGNLIRRVLKPAAVEAGLGEWVETKRGPKATTWVGFHTFRHTCASILFRQGWNIKQVQHYLGHHKASYTLDTYVHLLEGDLPDPTFLDGVTGGLVGHTWASGPPETAGDEATAATAISG